MFSACVNIKMLLLKTVLSVCFPKQILIKKTWSVLPRFEKHTLLLAETRHLCQQMTCLVLCEHKNAIVKKKGVFPQANIDKEDMVRTT